MLIYKQAHTLLLVEELYMSSVEFTQSVALFDISGEALYFIKKYKTVFTNNTHSLKKATPSNVQAVTMHMTFDPTQKCVSRKLAANRGPCPLWVATPA